MSAEKLLLKCQRLQVCVNEALLGKNAGEKNIFQYNDFAVVTLVCKDGQQVAVNCIYIWSIYVECKIAEILH